MMAEWSKAAGLRSASDITARVQTPLIVFYKTNIKQKIIYVLESSWRRGSASGP